MQFTYKVTIVTSHFIYRAEFKEKKTTIEHIHFHIILKQSITPLSLAPARGVSHIFDACRCDLL